MATKAYFMIDLGRKADKQSCSRAVEELEAIPEVNTVERIDGRFDLMVTVEAPQRVIFVANKIRTKAWAKGFSVCKVMGARPLQHAAQ
jgi:hypothetical protein